MHDSRGDRRGREDGPVRIQPLPRGYVKSRREAEVAHPPRLVYLARGKIRAGRAPERVVDAGMLCGERQGREYVSEVRNVDDGEYEKCPRTDVPHVGGETLLAEKAEQGGEQGEHGHRRHAAPDERERADRAGVHRHGEDGVRVEREEEQRARENETRVVPAEVFVAEKCEEEEQQERPRDAEDRRAPVENDETAPETAERELRRDGEDGAPPGRREPARSARLYPMQKRNGDKTNRGIRGEDRLRLPEVNALKEEVVKGETGDHRKRGEMPFIFANPEKNFLPHTGESI